MPPPRAPSAPAARVAAREGGRTCLALLAGGIEVGGGADHDVHASLLELVLHHKVSLLLGRQLREQRAGLPLQQRQALRPRLDLRPHLHPRLLP